MEAIEEKWNLGTFSHGKYTISIGRQDGSQVRCCAEVELIPS
jgi:hypothetical protein